MGYNVWEAKVLLGLYCQGVSNRMCDLILVVSKHVTNVNVTPYEIHILWMLFMYWFFVLFCFQVCVIVHFGLNVKWKI